MNRASRESGMVLRFVIDCLCMSVHISPLRVDVVAARLKRPGPSLSGAGKVSITAAQSPMIAGISSVVL